MNELLFAEKVNEELFDHQYVQYVEYCSPEINYNDCTYYKRIILSILLLLKLL